MKMLAALSFALLATLSGPARADTGAGSCPLVGALANATEPCEALRVAYRAELSDCMDKMEMMSRARAHAASTNNAHSSRARFLICDRHARGVMAAKAD